MTLSWECKWKTNHTIVFLFHLILELFFCAKNLLSQILTEHDPIFDILKRSHLKLKRWWKKGVIKREREKNTAVQSNRYFREQFESVVFTIAFSLCSSYPLLKIYSEVIFVYVCVCITSLSTIPLLDAIVITLIVRVSACVYFLLLLVPLLFSSFSSLLSNIFFLTFVIFIIVVFIDWSKYFLMPFWLESVLNVDVLVSISIQFAVTRISQRFFSLKQGYDDISTMMSHISFI